MLSIFYLPLVSPLLDVLASAPLLLFLATLTLFVYQVCFWLGFF